MAPPLKKGAIYAIITHDHLWFMRYIGRAGAKSLFHATHLHPRMYCDYAVVTEAELEAWSFYHIEGGLDSVAAIRSLQEQLGE
jgi:hypothetical protein